MLHAKKSPSYSATWINCPGCFVEESRLKKEGLLPEEKTSYEANEGTAAHALCDIVVNEMLEGAWSKTAEAYRGYVITVDGKGNTVLLEEISIDTTTNESIHFFPVEDEMIDNCNVYIKHFKDTVERMIGGKPEKLLIEYGITVDVETKVNLSSFGMEDIHGHLDLRISEHMGELHIIDFKYGKWTPVHAKNNTQLMIYALPENCGENDSIQDVYITIVQPRCYEVDSIQEWKTTPEYLKEWAVDVLKPASDIVDNGTGKPNPDDKQCKWCKCSGVCGEENVKFMKGINEEFPVELIEYPEERISDKDIDESINFTAEQFSVFLKKLPFFENVIKKTKEKALGLALMGENIDGFKLVEGIKHRQFRDKDAVEKFLKSKRIRKDDSHTTKLKSPAQISKIKKVKKEEIEEFIFKPVGDPTLVKLSDKRKEIIVFNVDDDDDLI